MEDVPAVDEETLDETLSGYQLACDVYASEPETLDFGTFKSLAGLDAHLDVTGDVPTIAQRLCVVLTGDVSDKPWAAVHRFAGSVEAVLTDTEAILTVARDLAEDPSVYAVRSLDEGVAAVASVAGQALKGFKGEDLLARSFGWTTGSMEDEDNGIDLWAGKKSIQVKVNGGSDKRWETHKSLSHVDFLVVIDAETGGIGVNECDPEFDGTAAYIKARDAE